MTDFSTDLTAGNKQYARTHRRLPSGVPARGLAVVTCMDARMDPLRVLHLKLGDAVILRVAGARIDETVLRGPLDRDLDALLRAPALREILIAGAVYDVATGRVRITRRHGTERSSPTAQGTRTGPRATTRPGSPGGPATWRP